MKTMLKTLIIALVVISAASCGSSQTSDTNKADSLKTEYGNAKVEVFYFHATRRCPTCLKIEEVAKELINTAYAGQDVKFYSINFDEDENKTIAEKYNVTWSSLFISSGEKFEDLTDLAFQVVTSDPKKLTDRMKSTIDVYLHVE